jgi:uncharacterized protein YbjT (DUF2867 family)
MIGSTSTILAVGVAGKFAGLVVSALAERGVTSRGLVRTQGKEKRREDNAQIAVTTSLMFEAGSDC